MGVEMSLAEVPLIQKRIIAAANRRNVPVVTATEMLESMISKPRPTRAEASDVANAILDGTDAVMLSGETAVGHDPVRAVRYMDRIIRATEAHRGFDAALLRAEDRLHSFPEAACLSAARAARLVQAKAIVTFTRSGASARLISKTRPSVPIYGFSSEVRTVRRLALYWGVTPVRMRFIRDTDGAIAAANRTLVDAGVVRTGDTVVFILGAPLDHQGGTNLMKIHRVGEA